MVLGCYVMGHRDRISDKATPTRDYYVTDGVYGAMNAVIYDHQRLDAYPLKRPSPAAPPAPVAAATPSTRSTVFGPTCDGLDMIFRDVQLPHLRIGDWLLFRDFGAYTVSGASRFNGVQADEP